MGNIKRRQFIQNLGGAVALSATFPGMLSAAGSPNQPKKRNIKKCLKFHMVEGDNLSILDKFKLLQDVGFDGVEFSSPNDFDNDEIVAAKEKTGLEIPGVVNSVHWDAPFSDPDPEVRKRCHDSVITALNDCKAYGGTTMLLVPAVVNAQVSYEDAYYRSQAEIRKVLPYTEETGIKIAIENVWNNFLLSPMEAARYVDELNHDMVGWYFDIGNIVRYGWPEHWIRTLGDRIMKLDVKEYSREKQREEGIYKGFNVKIGDGDNNWPAVMEAIDDIGYEGWASAEVGGGGRKRLKDIADRMDKVLYG